MDIRQLKDIKSRFVTRAVGDELVIVPLSGNVAQMNRLFTLNETGKFIWENSDNCMDTDGMANWLTENFEVKNADARRDLEAFLVKIESLLANA